MAKIAGTSRVSKDVQHSKVANPSLPDLSALVLMFRDDEHRLLTSMLSLCQADSKTATMIYISGPKGTGKTVLVKKVLDDLALSNEYIDCMVADTEEAIVGQIFTYLRSSDEDFSQVTEDMVCKKIFDLRKFLRLISSTEKTPKLIVLDGVEYVEKFSFVWSELTGLQKFCLPELRFVVISRSPLRLLAGLTYTFDDAIEVCLNKYTKEQLVELTKAIFHWKDNEHAAFILSYCQLIVENFGPVTSDVRQFRAYAQRYYAPYCATVSKDVTISHTQKLWKSVLPSLTAELRYGHRKGNENKAQTDANIKSLPLRLRFLIVAGFLCSYNSSRMDAKMLSKHHDRIKKRTPHTGIKKKLSEKRLTVLGPQTFGFDRVYSGFCAMMADVASDISPLQVQCSFKSLCDMQLFLRVGPEDNLDYPKYRCKCGKEYVEQIAASIGLELNRYLSDLV